LPRYAVFKSKSPAILSPPIDHALSESMRSLAHARRGKNLGSVVGDCFGACSLGEHSRASLEVEMTFRAFVGGCAIAAGTLACVCAAHAADLPVAPRPSPVAPVAYAPPVYNWSGFYVGGNIGGGFADSSWSDPFNGATNTFSKDG